MLTRKSFRRSLDSSLQEAREAAIFYTARVTPKNIQETKAQYEAASTNQ